MLMVSDVKTSWIMSYEVIILWIWIVDDFSKNLCVAVELVFEGRKNLNMGR